MRTLLSILFLVFGVMPRFVTAQTVYQAGSVPVTFSFAIVGAAPAAGPPGTYFSYPSHLSYYASWEVSSGTFRSETLLGVRSEAAAQKVTTVYNNTTFLAYLASQGVLPDGVPGGWNIMATPFSASDESGAITYSGFYAAKQGQNNVDLSSYIGTISTPVPIAYALSDGTNLITGKVSHIGTYRYVSATRFWLSLPIDAQGDVKTFSLSGLINGSAIDIDYLTISKQQSSRSFVTIPETMTVSRVTGSDLSTNNVPTTIIGSVTFGQSAPVKEIY